MNGRIAESRVTGSMTRKNTQLVTLDGSDSGAGSGRDIAKLTGSVEVALQTDEYRSAEASARAHHARQSYDRQAKLGLYQSIDLLNKQPEGRIIWVKC